MGEGRGRSGGAAANTPGRAGKGNHGEEKVGDGELGIQGRSNKFTNQSLSLKKEEEEEEEQ